jgi:glycosyltransferase involved in cell wall biosynthesis
LAEQLGIAGRVTFHGTLTQQAVAALLRRADLFVQHSITLPDGRAEAFGLSVAEAMAAGLPVVVSASGGLPDTVVDGETGVLVEEADVEGMADAIITLSSDAQRADALGRAGRERVLARFTHAHVRNRLRRLLELDLDDEGHQRPFAAAPAEPTPRAVPAPAVTEQ